MKQGPVGRERELHAPIVDEVMLDDPSTHFRKVNYPARCVSRRALSLPAELCSLYIVWAATASTGLHQTQMQPTELLKLAECRGKRLSTA